MVKVETDSCSDTTAQLAQQLRGLVPAERLYRSNVSLVAGTDVGPHVLAVSILEAEPK